MERELTETKEQRAEALNSLSTLCDFFQNRVLKGPSDEALREFNRATKEWVSVTYKELGEKVKNWQRAFADLGLNRGDRVAMLLPNGVNAVCFDQAAMSNLSTSRSAADFCLTYRVRREVVMMHVTDGCWCSDQEDGSRYFLWSGNR